MGGFILQMLRFTARAAPWIEAGLKPISFRTHTRKVLFASDAANGKKDTLTTAVYRDKMQDGTAREISSLSGVIDPLTSFARKSMANMTMTISSTQLWL